MIEQILRDHCSKEDLIKIVARATRSNPSEIHCLAISCEYNRNARCGTPSKHVLSIDGRCIGKTIKPMKSMRDKFEDAFKAQGF